MAASKPVTLVYRDINAQDNESVIIFMQVTVIKHGVVSAYIQRLYTR
jgi:hypothetical protein